jgi:hypothetical protein
VQASCRADSIKLFLSARGRRRRACVTLIRDGFGPVAG